MSALVRWDQLIAEVNGRSIFGASGVRDPESPCEAFRPKGAAFERVVEADLGYNRCETDGHYLCVECLAISVEALRDRESRCRECGTPLQFRDHERWPNDPTRCPACEPEDAL
jgi:hypothetical protein